MPGNKYITCLGIFRIRVPQKKHRCEKNGTKVKILRVDINHTFDLPEHKVFDGQFRDNLNRKLSLNSL